VTTLRYHEIDEWEEVLEREEAGNYEPGELQHEIKYGGEYSAKFILKQLLDEQRNLPRPCPGTVEPYDARYLRQLMNDEEKIFELIRIYNLPPASRDRHAYNVLKELDDSATLTFYRHRSHITKLFIGKQVLYINERRGRDLTERFQLAIHCHLPNTFSVSSKTSWEQQEIQRIALELRERQFENESKRLHTDWTPTYKIDSGIVIEPNTILRLPIHLYEKLVLQGIKFLLKAETKTQNTAGICMRIRELKDLRSLEERALEVVRLTTPGSDLDKIHNDTITLTVTRLGQQTHAVPFPRLTVDKGRYFQIQKEIRDIIRNASISRASSEEL